MVKYENKKHFVLILDEEDIKGMMGVSYETFNTFYEEIEISIGLSKEYRNKHLNCCRRKTKWKRTKRK